MVEADDRLAALLRRPGVLIRRAHQASVAAFTSACAELDVTPTQYGVLFVVDRVDGTDQVSLARVLGLDRSTTAMVVALLERRALIDRAQCPGDRRRKVLRLTPAGRTLLRRCERRAERSRRALLEPFDEAEQRAFLDLLERFVAHHEARLATDADAR